MRSSSPAWPPSDCTDIMLRNFALLLIASRAWAQCSSHDDCVGYCRNYTSGGYCRTCGDCMYDGITQWVTADPIDGVCPSRCEELPTLYDNGTLAFFNAATVAVNVYVGLNSVAACDSSDPGTSLQFSGVAALTWETTSSALYRMDDRFGEWNYYCVVPIEPSNLANSSTSAKPSIVFIAAFEESDSSSLGICSTSTALSGVGADYMRVMVAVAGISTSTAPFFATEDPAAGYFVSSGSHLNVGIAEDIVSFMDMMDSLPYSARVQAAYTGADGAQVELAAYDVDVECDTNVYPYSCTDADASVDVDVVYGSVMGCVFYETSGRLVSCRTLYVSGYSPTASPTITKAPTLGSSNSGEVSSAVRSTLAIGVFVGACVAAIIPHTG